MHTKSTKPTRRRTCELCGKNDMAHEPVWAMQFIASDTPSFYRLGSHIRGFGLLRICEECRQTQRADYDNRSRDKAHSGAS